MANTYVPQLKAGSRMLLSGKENHPENGRLCTILGAVPNPSQNPENQWYDVRFDDYVAGRFLAKYLHADIEENKREVA